MGMSRAQFWGELGHLSIIEPMILSAYESEERRIWLNDLESSPHGAPWHTSFHASAFPGDDPVACGRKAVYDLLDIPSPAPIGAKLRSIFDVGKNHELEWVRRLGYSGVLLSADQTAGDDTQTGFVDREHWLTGSPDVICVPPYWLQSHVVEIKTTSHEKVLAMQNDPEQTPWSHSKYLRQIKTYIGFAAELPFSPTVARCAHSGYLMRGSSCAFGPTEGPKLARHDGECDPELVRLAPPQDGTLIYASREDPLCVATYWITYDPNFLAAGRAKLAEWRDYFERGEIPPHPHEGQKSKWSVDPCQYCDYKAMFPKSKGGCKEDYTAKTTQLEDSALVDFASSVRPSYDYATARQRVLTRWGAEDRSTSTEREPVHA
jgi:hypothetical protein